MTGGGNAPRIQFQLQYFTLRRGTEDFPTTGYPACDMFRDLIARVNNGERDPRCGDWSLRPVLEDGTTYAGGWETITRNARGEYYGQEDQESASVRRWSAIYALDFVLFGGEATKEVFGNVVRHWARGIECQDSLREAFYELCRHPWPSNAAKVYALRGNRAQSGDADVAFARLAAAYGIGSAPYLQPEAGMD